ncbi:MAG: hypothetical protein OEM20_01760 [Gammaproteobacteria bacterium]|nr:hypothetical protein [Gammaproteobacteria bacterium]MDH3577554.1 hypothetical protein [Gammaproteobacteria bacterium]
MSLLKSTSVFTIAASLFVLSACGQKTAYDAANGEQLWTFFGQTGIVAAPISYEIDDEQYVAVASGWGGAYALAYGGVVPTGSEAGVGRVLTFKLGANEALPGISAIPASIAKPPGRSSAWAATVSLSMLKRLLRCAPTCLTRPGWQSKTEARAPEKESSKQEDKERHNERS